MKMSYVDENANLAALRKRRNLHTLGLMAAAGLALDGCVAVIVPAIRQAVAGQVTLRGLDIVHPDMVDALKNLEGPIAQVGALVVVAIVGGRVFSDLTPSTVGTFAGRPEVRGVDWKWSFWYPILIAAAVFALAYYYAFTATIGADTL